MKRLLLGVIVLCSGLFSALPAFSQNADLSVIKSDAPDPVSPGGNITYTISVTNNGPSPAVAVTLTDTVPTGTTFVSFTAPAGYTPVVPLPPVGGTGTVTVTNAGLGIGVTHSFTLVVMVNPGTPNGTVITNTASGASSTPDSDLSNNSSTTTTTVNLVAELSVSKSDAPDPVLSGGSITYTISVTNNGPDAAVDLVLTDDVPTGTTFVSFTAPAGYTPVTPAVGDTGTVTASNPFVVPGPAEVFTLVVQVDSGTSDGTVISNTADVTSTTLDTNLNNNTSTTTTSVSLPVITIDDVTVTEGDSGTVDACFTLTLSTPSPAIVTVELATADGTAVAPLDFINDSGPVSLLAGETSSEACVTVNSDLLEESDENFFVNMSNPVNAVIDDDQGIGTIVDDDGPALPTFPTGNLGGSGCGLAKNTNVAGSGTSIFLALFLVVGILVARRKDSSASTCVNS